MRSIASLFVGAVIFATLSTNLPAAGYLKDAATGDPKLRSVGAMSFGPGGLLLVTEPRHAAIVAIETGDTGPVQKLKQKVSDVNALLAARLGAAEGGVTIVDMAVNPASGKIYLSVTRKPDNASLIIVVTADGQAAPLDYAKARHARVSLPAADTAKVGNVSDVAFAGDRVLAAGSSNEEFSSKIFTLSLPLAHGGSALPVSAETYHVAHGKWETKAPITSFVPMEENGKHYVVGSFACTPIAKFELDDLKPHAQVTGTSVVELGSGNRPLDMFTYEKDGKQWLVTHTQRFHQNLFGPSKYWGARVDMSLIKVREESKINQKAVRRDVKQPKGPEGIEIVDSLFGAVHVDKLSNTEVVVLREQGASLTLEVAPLP
ncbi:MAG: hypothetical protein FJ392_03345 [Verrucomicrobia bacterium]|nr:hypothetical protein [Verrucomicrobiota bacterium]